MEVDPRLFEYYETLFSERDRLALREGQLELVRTRELLERFLPGPPGRVLDVGGGTGVYGSWLADRGYDVHLVDIVPAHVAAAAGVGTFTASLGDARTLPVPDASCDVVLLLGPLYHLRLPEDRSRALREAVRVLRPGGLVAAAFISRAAPALDGFVRKWVWDEGRLENMTHTVADGYLEGDRGGFGVISYFHLPSEARREFLAAGLEGIRVLGVEGPGWIAADFEERWDRPEGRKLFVQAARACEEDPELEILSCHLLGFGRRPGETPSSPS